MIVVNKQQYHYIYKVTRDDGKYYIGMHSTDDISDDYFGSGKYLLNSIRKHGQDKHTKEILEFLPTRKALRVREKEIVNEELLEDPFCMNMQEGGTGWSSEQLKKIWQDPEYKAKKSKTSSETMKKQWQDPEFRAKMSEAVSESNKKRWQDPEYKAKMSKILKENNKNPWIIGTMWIKHPELKSKRIKKDEPIPAGWGKGRRMNQLY